MSLHKSILAAIKKDGRSLYQLAIDSGVSRGQLVRFVNGERDLRMSAAGKLVEALGLELRPKRKSKGKS
ncbi:MAG: hypothetical protein HJJLKODD_02858 [Phycisphaerae bacterium]|nr:hypothetical protein [Phycisphaerae bacterium]